LAVRCHLGQSKAPCPVVGGVGSIGVLMLSNRSRVANVVPGTMLAGLPQLVAYQEHEARLSSISAPTSADIYSFIFYNLGVTPKFELKAQ